jgi:hypothetical protein
MAILDCHCHWRKGASISGAITIGAFYYLIRTKFSTILGQDLETLYHPPANNTAYVPVEPRCTYLYCRRREEPAGISFVPVRVHI